MTLMSLRAAWSAAVLAGCTAALTGCGINPGTVLSSSPETGTLSPINGKVYGGQQPIYGSHVYVFATGLGGVGTAATSELTAASDTSAAKDSNGNYYVVTNQQGYFTISVAPGCTVGTQAYLYIVGGSPTGGSTGPTNSAVGLLAPLGACSSSSTVVPPVSFVQANEITTVVTAYALAGFATSPVSIASGSSNLAKTGIANAMSTALNIVSVATGYASATSTVGNAVVPVDKINLIANALALCINTAGPTSNGCKELYTDTGAVSGSDTATVALTLAHAPFLSSAKSSDFYNGLGNTGIGNVFPVNLSSAPADYTLGLQYKTPQYTSGGVVNYSLAVDSGGNLWTRGTNTAGTTATFVKYSPLGSASTPITVTSVANSSYSPYIHLAIDSADAVWSGTVGGVIKITSGASTYTALSNGSCAISTDSLSSAVFGSNGLTYVGDLSGSNIWQFNSAGCTGSLTPPASTFFKGYLAPEKSGGFVASSYKNSNTTDNSYVLRYAAGATTPSSFLAGGDFLTTDDAGDVWAYSTIGGSTFDVLNEYNSSNAGLAPSAGYYQGGMETKNVNIRAGTEGPHMDGAGSAWLAVTPCDSFGACSADLVVGLPAGLGNSSSAITPSTGLALPNGETGAHALALDGSGNLWISVTDGSLIQYLGLTVPVATPTLYTNIGTKP